MESCGRKSEKSGLQPLPQVLPSSQRGLYKVSSALSRSFSVHLHIYTCRLVCGLWFYINGISLYLLFYNVFYPPHLMSLCVLGTHRGHSANLSVPCAFSLAVRSTSSVRGGGRQPLLNSRPLLPGSIVGVYLTP